MDKKPAWFKCQSEFMEDAAQKNVGKIVCEKRECESFNK